MSSPHCTLLGLLCSLDFCLYLFEESQNTLKICPKVGSSNNLLLFVLEIKFNQNALFLFWELHGRDVGIHPSRLNTLAEIKNPVEIMCLQGGHLSVEKSVWDLTSIGRWWKSVYLTSISILWKLSLQWIINYSIWKHKCIIFMIYLGQLIVQHYEMAVNYLCVCFTNGIIQVLNLEIIISLTWLKETYSSHLIETSIRSWEIRLSMIWNKYHKQFSLTMYVFSFLY